MIDIRQLECDGFVLFLMKRDWRNLIESTQKRNCLWLKRETWICLFWGCINQFPLLCNHLEVYSHQTFLIRFRLDMFHFPLDILGRSSYLDDFDFWILCKRSLDWFFFVSPPNKVLSIPSLRECTQTSWMKLSVLYRSTPTITPWFRFSMHTSFPRKGNLEPKSFRTFSFRTLFTPLFHRRIPTRLSSLSAL